MKKKIITILLSLSMILMLIPANVFASPTMEYAKSGGQIEVFGNSNGNWESLGTLTFEKKVSTQTVLVENDITELKIVKLSGYEVNLDELTLEGKCPAGYERKLSATDNDLIEIINETIFDLQGSGTLTISARAPATIPDKKLSFKFPKSNTYLPITPESEFLTYQLGSHNDSFPTGDTLVVPDKSNLFYNEMTYPGTGHPAAPMQIYLADDGTNLYAFFEVFLDNTFDHGEDFAAIHIKDGNEIKTYKVNTTPTNEYGKWYFEYTDSAENITWQHMSYVIEVPLSDLDTQASNLDVMFEYYGTGASGPLSELWLDGKKFVQESALEEKNDKYTNDSPYYALPEAGKYINSEGGTTPSGEWWLYYDGSDTMSGYTLTLNNATLEAPCTTDTGLSTGRYSGIDYDNSTYNNSAIYFLGNLNIALTDGSTNTIDSKGRARGILSYGADLNITGNGELNIKSSSATEGTNNGNVAANIPYTNLSIKNATVNVSAKDTDEYALNLSTLTLTNAKLNVEVSGESIGCGMRINNYKVNHNATPIHGGDLVFTINNSVLTSFGGIGSNAMKYSTSNNEVSTNYFIISAGSSAEFYEGTSAPGTLVSTLTNTLGNTKNFESYRYIKVDNEIRNEVTLSGGGTGATGSGSYKQGKTVNLNAGEKSGYTFKGWASDDVTITNPSNTNASFVMPNKNVTVTANWEIIKKDNKTPITKDPIIYKIIKNDNATWRVGSETHLNITCNGDLSKFQGITVDGKTIEKTNYSTSNENKTISLQKDYLKTLSAGEHTLRIIYTDGYAKSQFTIDAIANTGVNDCASLAIAGIVTSIAGVSAIRRKRQNDN